MPSHYGSSSMKSKLPMNTKKKKKDETTAKKKMVRSEAKEKKEKVGAKTGRGSKKFPDMNKDGKLSDYEKEDMTENTKELACTAGSCEIL